MYRKIYECQVKMWQSDATGKRALKWITRRKRGSGQT